MTLEDILDELYRQANDDGYLDENNYMLATAKATTRIHALINEKLRQPIHEEKKKKAGEAPTKDFNADYLDGVWNALYWALSKVDALFEEEIKVTDKESQVDRDDDGRVVANWEVRVYGVWPTDTYSQLPNNIIAYWVIEGCTYEEALHEADDKVQSMGNRVADWVMVEIA